MNKAVILLGSNTGDLSRNLLIALSLIKENIGSINLASHIYETEPWGNSDQPEYFNQVVEVLTKFDAPKLLTALLGIEMEMGRRRTEKWAPRLIDLDILYFNCDLINEKDLIVPHPHLHERRFVLEPLSEILPDKVHPGNGMKTREMLSVLKDNLRVQRRSSDLSFLNKTDFGGAN